MNLLEVEKIYKECISNSDILQKGKQYLEEFLFNSHNFIICSLEIFLTSNYDKKFRIFVGVFIKNLIKDNWEICPNLTNNKGIIREAILKGIELNILEPKIMEIIGLIISDLIIRDGVEIWHNYLIQFLILLENNNINIVISTISLFTILFSKADNRIHTIVPFLFPKLLNLFKIQNQNKLHEKCLILFYLAINSFSYADGSDKKIVNECFDKTFNDWIKIFINYLESDTKIYVTLQRYSSKILTVFFRDFPYYSKSYSKQITFHILKSLSDIIPNFILNNLIENQPVVQSKLREDNEINLDDEFMDEEGEWNTEIEGLLIQIIELISTLVGKKELKSLIKMIYYPLITNLCYSLFLENHQEKQWINDPNQFVSDEEDEANMNSLRNVSLKLISQLIDIDYDEILEILNLKIDDFIKNSDLKFLQTNSSKYYEKIINYKNYNEIQKIFDFTVIYRQCHPNFNFPELSWKKKEVAFLLLGSFSQEIIENQEKLNPDFKNEMIINLLLREISIGINFNLVKARGLWCLSKFVNYLSFENKLLILEILKLSDLFLNEPELATKLIATKTISLIIYKIFSLNIHEDLNNFINIEELIKKIFTILPKASEETIHILLEAFVNLNKVCPNYRVLIAQLGNSYFLKLFQMFHNDLMVGNIILELIGQLLENEICYQLLYTIFYEFIYHAFQIFNNYLLSKNNNQIINNVKQTDISLITNLMDILNHFLKYGKNEAKLNFYPLIKPLLSIILMNEEVSLEVHAIICLRNFIKYFTNKILEDNLVPYFMNILEKLTNEKTNEDHLVNIGNLTLLIFQNLTNGKIDVQILKNLIIKLNLLKTPSIVQNILLIFARLINLSTNETIEFLLSIQLDENQTGLHIIIEKIMAHQILFKGKLLKNCLFLALINIFNYNNSIIENLKLNQNIHNKSKIAKLNILSSLIKAINFDINPKDINIKHKEKENIIENDKEDLDEDYEDFDEDLYENEEYYENDDNPLIDEDLIYLNDISSKIDLNEVLFNFFTQMKSEYYDFLNKEENILLKKLLNKN